MPVRNLTLEKLNEARAKLNRLNDGRKIRDDAGACRFINERGFVLLMPIGGIPLPSLSEADDAGHGMVLRLPTGLGIGKKLCRGRNYALIRN